MAGNKKVAANKNKDVAANKKVATNKVMHDKTSDMETSTHSSSRVG